MKTDAALFHKAIHVDINGDLCNKLTVLKNQFKVFRIRVGTDRLPIDELSQPRFFFARTRGEACAAVSPLQYQKLRCDHLLKIIP